LRRFIRAPLGALSPNQSSIRLKLEQGANLLLVTGRS
jgi:hypothetical protein